MIDPEAQRRALDAVLAARQATANASAPAGARELLREANVRLRFRSPNIRDLLSTFSRVS